MDESTLQEKLRKIEALHAGATSEGEREATRLLAREGRGETPGMKTFVFSRTLRQQDYPGTTIVAEKAEEIGARLRTEPGKDIWLFGGGSLFGSLLNAKLVDTVEVAIIPVLPNGGAGSDLQSVHGSKV